MRLLKAVIKIQEREDLSHVDMAEILGISRQHWWRIRTEREPMSAEIRERALNQWQKKLLPIFLSEQVANSNMKEKES